MFSDGRVICDRLVEKSDIHCRIKETLLIRDLKPALIYLGNHFGNHVTVRPSEPPHVRTHHRHTNSTGMATQMQLEVTLAGNRMATHGHPRVVKQWQLKSQKRQTKSGNCFCIRVRVQRERQRKRKNRRQASEAQREKERGRAWAREISAGTSNGTNHFGLVRPECSGPALKVVLFDRYGHFGR